MKSTKIKSKNLFVNTKLKWTEKNFTIPSYRIFCFTVQSNNKFVTAFDTKNKN